MKSVSISDLKANLSRYLRIVRRGGEVQILDRGTAVARLTALQGSDPGRDAERIRRLASMGVLRVGKRDLSWLLREPLVVAPNAELSGDLAADREDRL